MKVACQYCSTTFHSPTKKHLECPSCGSTDSEDFRFGSDDPIQTDNPLVYQWVKIGRSNSWIAAAYDPPFDERSFYECPTAQDLIQKLDHGNWSTGTAFYYKNLAFINQINGGDEWLVIRDNIKFESWSCGRVIERYGSDYFATQLYQMLHASDDQLRELNYKDVEVPQEFELDGYCFHRIQDDWRIR